eukprot:CAMPEP_0176036116 /NCGR_PEP_ID=MMETSP0120_2-20121206/17885_1 /TAXON_ID=160619 /ORGANISM="Kryptoperidinium foliaceum, Strain CCMP 1326" /LENGTH=45 /DNA_ID= /DNA_START= /DNA_END= /DNA_ORIENTATION=
MFPDEKHQADKMRSELFGRELAAEFNASSRFEFVDLFIEKNLELR